eukprot:1110109-Rhodomonas_salina.3
MQQRAGCDLVRPHPNGRRGCPTISAYARAMRSPVPPLVSGNQMGGKSGIVVPCVLARWVTQKTRVDLAPKVKFFGGAGPKFTDRGEQWMEILPTMVPVQR